MASASPVLVEEYISSTRVSKKCLFADSPGDVASFEDVDSESMEWIFIIGLPFGVGLCGMLTFGLLVAPIPEAIISVPGFNI